MNTLKKYLVNWFIHTDNNLFFYDDRPLIKRFPEKKIYSSNNDLEISNFVKSILKGNIDINITGVHNLNSKLIGCNGFGKIQKIINNRINETDFYYYYIDHYWSKSTEEFTNKLTKGDVFHGYKDDRFNLFRIKTYFAYNKITTEKINYIENKTKYNLSKYRLMIKE